MNARHLSRLIRLYLYQKGYELYVKELKYVDHRKAITIPAPVVEIFINKTVKIKDDEANKLIYIAI